MIINQEEVFLGNRIDNLGNRERKKYNVSGISVYLIVEVRFFILR